MDWWAKEERERWSESLAFTVQGNIFHDRKNKEKICALGWVKDKPGGGTIDSLFKRPLTLHTLL